MFPFVSVQAFPFRGLFSLFSDRDITLFGSNAIFFAVAAALYLYPEWALIVFPAASLLYFWSDLRRDDELQVIFMFLCTAGALLLMSQMKDLPSRTALGVELAGIWVASLGLGFHRGRLKTARQVAGAQAQQMDARVRELERDLKFYGAFESAAAHQIRLRRDLTGSAKTLTATMDAKDVQMRLVNVLEKRFQGSRVRILAGEPPDSLTQLSTATRASVLVKDTATDERLRGQTWSFRAAVVSPLYVVKKPYGFVRVESDKPAAFSADDLRTVDLFATMTSLTLENIEFYQTVNDLATHDALTKLFTHKAFQNRLADEILRAGRSQAPLSVVMCDVDHFKKYNDTYGHQAGDFLLQRVAQILSDHARPVDFVARYGGEEFTIILPGVAHAQAIEFANRIRVKVMEEPFMFQGQLTRVTQSYGVSTFPEDATTASQLVRAADERLYKAKEGGRNQVVG